MESWKAFSKIYYFDLIIYYHFLFQIEDENDNRPIPDAPEYRFHVTENTPGQTIVATVTGRDRDATGNRISHEIVSGDPDGYFIINPSTEPTVWLGSLISLGIPLRPHTVEYPSHSNNSTTSDIKLVVMRQIATTDRPIDRETSFISNQGLPTDEVHLVIQLTDSGEPSKTTVVHATAVIDDVNDNTPQFLFTGTECGSQVEEGEECYHFVHRLSPHGNNSSCLGRVFAVDLDRGANGTVVYEMAQPDSFFSVDPVSGLVCPTGAPLTEPSENLIWVTASDHGSPPRFTTQPIAIHISVQKQISDLDLPADYQIRFISLPPKKLTVSPRTPPGTVLYNMEVVLDTSLNANWTFSFAANFIDVAASAFVNKALSRWLVKLIQIARSVFKRSVVTNPKLNQKWLLI
ncbi:unnamed protein product [Rodentolepis nana]|uniref:Cadherin domain-containing protein n=1 Tax=Rodentolepis nana TaxID=102285 RepID=A0A3P7TMZ8_RODNA|nr:unnamed protein product [Rodentolepis nana]